MQQTQQAGANHVMLGDALGDADDQIQLRLNGLQDGLRCERGRHIDHARVCCGLLLCLLQSQHLSILLL